MINRILIYLVMLITVGRALEFFPFLAPLQLGKVVIGGATVYVAMTFNGIKRNAIINNPLSKHIGLIIILGGLSIPFSVWPGGAFNSFLGYMRIMLIFAVLCALAGATYSQSVINAAMLTVAVLALLMFFARGAGGRISVSSTYDPNDIALLFTIFLPHLIISGITSKNIMRYLWFAVAGLALTGIALTQSRGAIVALAAITLYCLTQLKKGRIAIFLLACIGFGIVAYTADDAFWDRFTTLQTQEDYNFEAKEGRVEIWKNGLVIMAKNPLLGIGIGQFSSAMGMIGNGVYLTAHNAYIQIGAELGIFGLAAYLLMLWKIAVIARRGMVSSAISHADRLRYMALLIGLIGFMAGSCFLSQAYGPILCSYQAVSAALAMHLVRLENEAAIEKADLPDAQAVTPIPPPAREEYAQHSLAAKAAAKRAKREQMLKRGDEAYKKRRSITGPEKSRQERTHD